jgi:hypothetical protein
LESLAYDHLPIPPRRGIVIIAYSNMNSTLRKSTLFLVALLILGALFIACFPSLLDGIMEMSMKSDSMGFMIGKCCIVQPFEHLVIPTAHAALDAAKNLLLFLLVLGAFMLAWCMRRATFPAREPPIARSLPQRLSALLSLQNFERAIFRGLIHPRLYEPVIVHS